MKALCLVSLLLCIAPSAFSQSAWYRSNELGMQLGPLASVRSEYRLQIIRNGAVQTRILYQGNAETRRWIRQYGAGGLLLSETEKEKGATVQIQKWNAQGQLILEQFYQAGTPYRWVVYEYADSRLVRKQSILESGATEYEDNYRYFSDGSLREMVRKRDSGQEITGYVFTGGTLSHEYHLIEKAEYLFTYDSTGRLAAEDSWKEGKALRRVTLRYADGGALPRERIIQELTAGTLTTIRYDESGRVASQETVLPGGVSENWTFRHENGRLVEKQRSSGRSSERWTYEYNTDGSHLRDSQYLNGQISLVISYQPDDVVVEERYWQGEILTRIYYRDGLKFKEELLKNGQVIQTREQ